MKDSRDLLNVWLFVGIVALLAAPLHSQDATAPLAPRPPMGWNSWDAYGLSISEEQFRADVDVLAKQLHPFGYDYAVIDEGWFMQNPEARPTPAKLRYKIDPNGRFEPVTSRYPSAAATPDAPVTSFRAIGDYVHSRGLKFGVHIVRGIPRAAVKENSPIESSEFHAVDAADTKDACWWDPTTWGVRDTPAGQAWYDSLLRQYASWGVDFLKVDCIAFQPYKRSEIKMIQKAIAKTGRPIVLSLSPGPTSLTHAAEVGTLAQMWRISGDIWDFWQTGKRYPRGVGEQFAAAASWAKYSKSGNWPDADMLPLGWLGPTPGYGKARNSRLTLDEERTQLTLWSMLRLPLIVGANLTRLDPATLALITNRDVLHIDQDSHGGQQVRHDGNLIVWKSEGDHGQVYLAFFNAGLSPLSVPERFTEYLPRSETYSMRNLWTGQALAAKAGDRSMTLARHACLLLEFKPGEAAPTP